MFACFGNKFKFRKFYDRNNIIGLLNTNTEHVKDKL